MKRVPKPLTPFATFMVVWFFVWTIGVFVAFAGFLFDWEWARTILLVSASALVVVFFLQDLLDSLFERWISSKPKKTEK